MKILRITAKRAGFRRAGIAHPDHAVDHPVDALTPAQIAALRAEPVLVVHEIDIAPAAPAQEPPADPAAAKAPRNTSAGPRPAGPAGG
ncbi:MAG: hypothetical protein OHK0024_32750 [Thalassobaculales bacterium]